LNNGRNEMITTTLNRIRKMVEMTDNLLLRAVF
jgi:hypothetical protein